MKSEDFEIEIFRQVNEHMRATERKYWVSTSSYLGLLLLFLSKASESNLILYTPNESEMFASIKYLLLHIIISFFGIIIYLMQNWYRSWKEHYLDILYEIRQKLYQDKNNNKYLPYWLRNKPKNRTISIDNSLQLVTFLINTSFIILVCIEISYILPNFIGKFIAGLNFAGYILVLYIFSKITDKDNQLNA